VLNYLKTVTLLQTFKHWFQAYCTDTINVGQQKRKGETHLFKPGYQPMLLSECQESLQSEQKCSKFVDAIRR